MCKPLIEKIKVNVSLQALNAKGHFTFKPHLWSLHKKRLKKRKGVRIIVFLFFCEYEKKKEREEKRGYFPLKFKKGKVLIMEFLRHILSLLAHGQGGPKRQGVLSLLSLRSKGLKSRPKYLPLTHKEDPPTCLKMIGRALYNLGLT